MQLNLDNNVNQTNQQGNAASYGAHECIECHEILSDTINGINQFELYRPHVKDQKLGQILDRQINFMIQEYNNLVNHLHNRDIKPGSTYQAQSNFSPKLGLRNPSPESPNYNINQLNDRDIASGMLGWAKSSVVFTTLAALECTDPNLRNIMKNCVLTKFDMAYETFQYMNQMDFYQVPTMQENTTQTMVNSYQPANIL